MPGGVAGGDDCIQDATGALGQGADQTGKKILPRVLRSDAPLHTKIEAWYHLTANLSYPLMIVLSVLILPAAIINFYQGWFQMLFIDFPLFMASTFSISSFTWFRSVNFFPELAACAALSANPYGSRHWIDHY